MMNGNMNMEKGMGMMPGEAGPERIYAFSDGVFAIIITIMILELKRPESATFHALFDLWPTWLAYGVSYLFIAIVWINHHFLMRFAQTARLKLMWVNFAHLFCVSVIPFLTKWLSETRLAPVPMAMYAFDFILVNITYLLLVFETVCDDTVGSITAKARYPIHLRFGITLGLFTLAMVVAFWFPYVSFGLVVGCLILYIKPDVPRLLRHLDMHQHPTLLPSDKTNKTTTMTTKIAIITGASAGIGRATALRLAKDYSGLVLVAREADQLEKTAAAIRSQGAEPLVIAADLRLVASVDKVIGETLQKFGRIDALVNIAGAVPQIHLFEMTDEQWNDGAEMKLHGARRLAIKAWPYLKAVGGSVVFMSGNSAESPKPGFAAVATINAAICALARAFAEQGILDGVQVNSILPGPVMSNRRIGFLEKWSKANNLTMEAAKEKFLEEAHVARYGEPGEIAELIGFLLSPGAQWLTGSAIRMDGGEIKTI